MSGVEPLRGEVHDCRFPAPIGAHPGVVLTVNTLIPRIASVIVALVNGTPGPRPLRSPVGAEAGLTGHRESYVDPTSIFTVSKAQLRSRRGRLSPAELASVEHGLATVIGLELADADRPIT